MKFLLYFLLFLPAITPCRARDLLSFDTKEAGNTALVTSFYLFNTISNDFSPAPSISKKSHNSIPSPVSKYKIINPLLFTSPTEWYQVLVAAIVFILLWQTLQYYISRKFQKQRAEIDKLLYLEQERTRITRDLNDGLGSELFGLKLLGQVALARKKDVEATNDLKKIVEMAKDISEKVSEIIWVSDVNQDSLISFWSYLQKYIHLLLRPAGIPYYFKSLPTDDNVTLSAERRHHLLSFYKFIVAELLNSEKIDGTALFFKMEQKDLYLYISPIPALNWHEDTLVDRVSNLSGTISQSDTNQFLIQIPLNG
jgi:hypothetical protein